MGGGLARRLGAALVVAVIVVAVAGAALSALSKPRAPALRPVPLDYVRSQLASCPNSSMNEAYPLLSSLQAVNSTYLRAYGVTYEYYLAVLGSGRFELPPYTVRVQVEPLAGGSDEYEFYVYYGGRLANETGVTVYWPLVSRLCSYLEYSRAGNVTFVVVTHYSEAYLLALARPDP